MHAPMPGVGGPHPGHHRMMRRRAMLMCFVLCESLFWTATGVCALGALNRMANALKLESRVKALKAVPDAFTEEERSELVHKIAVRAMGPL
jgi:hypothetical protein